MAAPIRPLLRLFAGNAANTATLSALLPAAIRAFFAVYWLRQYARCYASHFPLAKKYHICRRQMSIPPLHSWRGGGRQAGGEVKGGRQAGGEVKGGRQAGDEVKGGRQAGGEVQRPRFEVQNLFRFFELELVQ